MKSRDMRLKKRRMERAMQIRILRPQVVATLSTIRTKPDSTRGMSRTPGRMHQKGRRPVVVRRKILATYQTE
jgi:hypothetical protein